MMISTRSATSRPFKSADAEIKSHAHKRESRLTRKLYDGPESHTEEPHRRATQKSHTGEPVQKSHNRTTRREPYKRKLHKQTGVRHTLAGRRVVSV